MKDPVAKTAVVTGGTLVTTGAVMMTNPVTLVPGVVVLAAGVLTGFFGALFHDSPNKGKKNHGKDDDEE